ncbi:MFS transporter [Shewanella algae]|uniref:MFS transporter n=1 Tax=Shewanella algae TaxID=38313 RepID=UPI0031F53033
MTLQQPYLTRLKAVALLLLLFGGALALRPFLTSPGPLLAQLSSELGIEVQALGWLTSMPMLLMGVGALTASWLPKRLSSLPGVALSLGLLTLALVLRARVTMPLLWLSTLLAGLAVAWMQLQLPGLIKQHFAGHLPVLMGGYSALLMGGGALGAGVTPWLMTLFSEGASVLALWALPCIPVLLLALWLARRDSQPTVSRVAPLTEGSIVSTSGEDNPAPAKPSLSWRRAKAWSLLLSFGLINGGYASLVAWLPLSYQKLGMSQLASGRLVALMALAQMFSALTLPLLAGRFAGKQAKADRRPWLWLALIAQLVGFMALALWPQGAPVLWSLLLGVGLGGSFSLTLLLVHEEYRGAEQTAGLSAMVQGGGFLLAALPPLILPPLLLDGAAPVMQSSTDFAPLWLLHWLFVLVVTVLCFGFGPSGLPARRVTDEQQGVSKVHAQ